MVVEQSIDEADEWWWLVEDVDRCLDEELKSMY
jgi:hypothetical protein